MLDFRRPERIYRVVGHRLGRLGRDVEQVNQPFLTAETLCARYAPRVYRFAVMVAKGDVEAEDLAQEALARAIRNLPQFNPRRGSMESWLWQIVVNAARDAGRISTRRRTLWERIRSQPAPSQTTEDLAISRLTAAQLLEAIRRLNPRERGLIALRFGAGLGYAEVGAAYRMSGAAAGMAIRRALDRVRFSLEEAQ